MIMEDFNALELAAMHTALSNYLVKLNSFATYPIDTKLAAEIAATKQAIEKVTALFATKTGDLSLL